MSPCVIITLQVSIPGPTQKRDETKTFHFHLSNNRNTTFGSPLLSFGGHSFGGKDVADKDLLFLGAVAASAEMRDAERKEKHRIPLSSFQFVTSLPPLCPTDALTKTKEDQVLGVHLAVCQIQNGWLFNKKKVKKDAELPKSIFHLDRRHFYISSSAKVLLFLSSPHYTSFIPGRPEGKGGKD